MRIFEWRFGAENLVYTSPGQVTPGVSPVDINPRRVWTVADAKARLSEILRLCEEEGP